MTSNCLRNSNAASVIPPYLWTSDAKRSPSTTQECDVMEETSPFTSHRTMFGTLSASTDGTDTNRSALGAQLYGGGKYGIRNWSPHLHHHPIQSPVQPPPAGRLQRLWLFGRHFRPNVHDMRRETRLKVFLAILVGTMAIILIWPILRGSPHIVSVETEDN